MFNQLWIDENDWGLVDKIADNNIYWWINSLLDVASIFVLLQSPLSFFHERETHEFIGLLKYSVP